MEIAGGGIPEPSGYKALVPIMTSDTEPTGRAISSGYYASFYTYYAFDDSDNYWHSQDGVSSTNIPWVGYKFDAAVMVTHLLMKNRSSGAIRTPIHPTLQGSNDGTVWYTIQEFTVTNFDNNGISEFEVNNDNYYLYYRLFGGLNNNNDYAFNLTKLQLYGYEDTSIQYLYNNGAWSVGIENPGSNFNRSGTKYSQGATLSSNKFTLPSVSSVGSLIGLQKVDLTNIKLVQVKCKGLSSTTSYYCILRISDGYNLDSSTVKYANITSNQEHTVPIDVSGLTGYYYITLSCNINMSCEVYEIYLQK